ncbi:MAG: MOSC domain-containing protein [Pseudonocardiales bacterium]|nr:MAG: MOSC domain-containing protein [Pseudonocardiales bacterium]
MNPVVSAVSRGAAHAISKPPQDSIRLLADLGVEGDAHLGVTVQHLSRVARDPSQPNLRQVHLIHAELHDQLSARGFALLPGQMGENITTRGLDVLALPTGTRLHLGADAVIEVTGLRNPCLQLNGLYPGLLAAVVDRDEQGNIVRKAGVMGVVLVDGDVRPGDPILVELGPRPYRPLEPV